MRWPAAIRYAGAAIGGIAAIAAAGWLGGYRINTTPSYSVGLWRIEALGRPAAIGDLVFICPPLTPAFAMAFERGYIRRGLCPGRFSPLIKTVVAAEGQSVDIGEHVSVEGRLLTHSKVHPVDAEGRALVAWQGGVVPAGFLYLHSDYVGSYDSRYFGPIPAAGLLGRAVPVLTFEN
ncbi:conjugative transfer signal peptidase TraF [Aminobacter aminovorans]|uniref:Conjugative transfer signal peptidase TraF n=1 Tax=Aminobacter aminovorans TaxID=83263 RepID=A0AAC8YW59_AMIAI|nr:conjugative transfer signal peptidase TraF [Aminobacter aminovorans]AMS45532.1 Conujugal transfer protein TraF [Aminobacter aminovorans]MBB3708607.1 conjugative transfer signal peptidase TraF [Aminobacter aminovorans]